jgi:hypothetical protein
MVLLYLTSWHDHYTGTFFLVQGVVKKNFSQNQTMQCLRLPYWYCEGLRWVQNFKKYKSKNCLQYFSVAVQAWPWLADNYIAQNYNSHTLELPQLFQTLSVTSGLPRGGFGGFKPSPKFRSFHKAEPNSQFRGKYNHNCLMFLFHHPN